MMNKGCHNCPVPPADLVLDLIRSAPETDSKFLAFYDPYIGKAAVEPVYRYPSFSVQSSLGNG